MITALQRVARLNQRDALDCAIYGCCNSVQYAALAFLNLNRGAPLFRSAPSIKLSAWNFAAARVGDFAASSTVQVERRFAALALFTSDP